MLYLRYDKTMAKLHPGLEKLFNNVHLPKRRWGHLRGDTNYYGKSLYTFSIEYNFIVCCCQDDDNFYRFLVSPNGSYVIGARLDGKWIDMPRWMMSEYIEKGYNANHLKVICKGNQIEVYVNGHYLTSVVDDSFADGYIGGMIGTVEPGAYVAFDNLKVYGIDHDIP